MGSSAITSGGSWGRARDLCVAAEDEEEEERGEELQCMSEDAIFILHPRSIIWKAFLLLLAVLEWGNRGFSYGEEIVGRWDEEGVVGDLYL